MSIPDAQQKIEEILENYVVAAREELAKRWDARDIARLPMETYEVLGALLARQVTLATQMARNPGIWNWHMIPHILRSMADVHITMAWILMDPVDRSKKFIAYGLGQQKLILEHIKSKFKDESAADEKKKAVELIEAWIDSQKFSFLTDVNVGNWAGRIPALWRTMWACRTFTALLISRLAAPSIVNGITLVNTTLLNARILCTHSILSRKIGISQRIWTVYLRQQGALKTRFGFSMKRRRTKRSHHPRGSSCWMAFRLSGIHLNRIRNLHPPLDNTREKGPQLTLLLKWCNAPP